MSHPKELIEKIKDLLLKSYPEPHFIYAIEQRIPELNRVFYPDILIRDHAGSIQCAVEIGYTRPEKLTEYRKGLKIPDVRWYDKEGNLHGDVTERVEIVCRQISERQMVMPDRFHTYTISGQTDCWNDDCIKDGPDVSGDELLEYACDDVSTLVITDHVIAAYPSFCNKCGRFWMADPDYETTISIDLETTTPKRFLKMYPDHNMMTLQGVTDHLAKFGHDLTICDFDWLREEREGSLVLV